VGYTVHLAGALVLPVPSPDTEKTNMERAQFDVTVKALDERWGVGNVPAPIAGKDDRELLLDALEERVTALIHRDFDKLRTALYRLDVPEPQFKAALGQPDLKSKARALAVIILERETRKVETWLKYAAEQQRDAARKQCEIGTADETTREVRPDASE
jgi:hypothetical protein